LKLYRVGPPCRVAGRRPPTRYRELSKPRTHGRSQDAANFSPRHRRDVLCVRDWHRGPARSYHRTAVHELLPAPAAPMQPSRPCICSLAYARLLHMLGPLHMLGRCICSTPAYARPLATTLAQGKAGARARCTPPAQACTTCRLARRGNLSPWACTPLPTPCGMASPACPPYLQHGLAADSQRVHGALLPEAFEISLWISLSRHPSPRLPPPSLAPCVCTRHSRTCAASADCLCGFTHVHVHAPPASADARAAGTRHPTPPMPTSEQLSRRGRGCRRLSPVQRRASGSAAAAAYPCGRGAHQG